MRNHPAPGRAGTSAPVLSTALLQAGFWQRVQAGSPHGAALVRPGQILFRAALAGTAGCQLPALPCSGARVLNTPLGSQQPPASPHPALGCCCTGPMGWGCRLGGCRVQLRAKLCGAALCRGEGLCLLYLLPVPLVGEVHPRPPHAFAVLVASPSRWQSPALADVLGE